MTYLTRAIAILALLVLNAACTSTPQTASTPFVVSPLAEETVTRTSEVAFSDIAGELMSADIIARMSLALAEQDDPKIANLGGDDTAEEAVLAQAYDAANLEEIGLAGSLIYRQCQVSIEESDPGFPSAQVCSCAVGYAGGSLPARDFILFGYASALGLVQTEQEEQGILALILSKGYSIADLERLAALLGDSRYGQRGDVSCQNFQTLSPTNAGV